MQIISWVCLVLLTLGVTAEATAAAVPAKIVIGFAAMNARVTPLWAAKHWDEQVLRYIGSAKYSRDFLRL
jgi:hypothetical protein